MGAKSGQRIKCWSWKKSTKVDFPIFAKTLSRSAGWSSATEDAASDKEGQAPLIWALGGVP